MRHKLSVLVQVDLDGKHVRLVVTGCLTEVNHRALCPLLRRARTLVPGIEVLVDVTPAHHVEAAAVDLLRWAAEHDDDVAGTAAVDFVLPAELPSHGGLDVWSGGAAPRVADAPRPEGADALEPACQRRPGPRRSVRSRTAD